MVDFTLLLGWLWSSTYSLQKAFILLHSHLGSGLAFLEKLLINWTSYAEKEDHTVESDGPCRVLDWGQEILH